MFLTLILDCNLLYAALFSFALKITIDASISPSAVIPSNTEQRHFSWFYVCIIICLAPFFAIVLVNPILKKIGVSAKFPILALLKAYSILKFLISFKNREPYGNNYQVIIAHNAFLVLKVYPFLLRNL